MRIVPVYIQGRCEQSGLPKEKVSRYTVRPGTLGLTLSRRTDASRMHGPQKIEALLWPVHLAFTLADVLTCEIEGVS